VFVGYQAQGTLGRQIVEGRPEVRINGRIAKVRAGIEQIRGFSGHAGKSDLMRWLKSFGRPPRRLFLTHGDGEAALDLAAHIERELGWSVTVPAYGDSMILE
jgi:metallo-beta-lactamase family protein